MVGPWMGQIGWFGQFGRSTFLFLLSPLTFDLEISIESNKFIIICKFQNNILGTLWNIFHVQGKYSRYSYTFWPIGPYINIFCFRVLGFKFYSKF